ncbi:hypothetical protein [Wolbachia endosymbiont (group B) of Lycaena phlaeas]|uniref:hypothetical protein n=1 Tax=Wolbachia endosymbiont (group B) of Lycaena phlaeas TaxID=2954027 RepID=UPI00222F4154|nr:hypothetical protein [Wolbachia endosymbiont (group B) of Lycaena phlaeas]
MSYEGLIKEKKEDYEKHCIVEATESGCKLDCEIFKTFRDKPIVKSIKTGEEVGGVNESAWYFQLKGGREQLVLDVLGDGNYPSVTGKNANYLKVLPCGKGQFHRLELCDKDGTIFKKTENGARISISKCNLVGGGDIELNKYVRKDWLPSFIIKPSTSKEFGEAIGEKSRAEVYTYDPINGKVGDKVAKLNTTILHGDTICSYLLALGTSYGKNDYDDRYFPINSKKIIVQKEENGSYEIEIDNPLLNIREKSTKASKEMINLFLDDLLCLCDESVLSDGYGVEISGW